MADWANLPEIALFLIAARLFSLVEFKRFRSICTTWRSSVSGRNIPFPNKPLILLTELPGFSFTGWFDDTFIIFVSRAAFFRVTLSSSPSQGWLIKSDVDINSGKLHLLDPLTRLPMRHSFKSVDLSEYTFTEIRETYELQDWQMRDADFARFKRVVPIKDGEAHHNRILGIHDGKIEHWDGKNWRELTEKDLKSDDTLFFNQFSDIILHQGLVYALDARGIVWWISSNLEIFRYGPRINDEISHGHREDKSFVECCGELYIVDHFRKRKNDVYVSGPITVGFKVYKFDEELGKMIEVKSLGDKAFVMATDTCFSVLAHEFYGCLQNSIYFTDDEEEIKVFTLDTGSITTMSESSQSCFQMFVPTFP